MKKLVVALAALALWFGSSITPAYAQGNYSWSGSRNVGACSGILWSQWNSNGNVGASDFYVPGCAVQVKLYYSDMYGHYHLYVTTFGASRSATASPGCTVIYADYNVSENSGPPLGFRIYGPT